MGYIDTRPAPAFVISWPVAAVNPGLPYDGPVVGSGSYPDLPESQGWYENFVDDYIERTNIHFKKVKPDIDDRSPDFLACNPTAAHNHVVGYGPGGRLAAVAAMPCWVTYRGAVRVPGFFNSPHRLPLPGWCPRNSHCTGSVMPGLGIRSRSDLVVSWMTGITGLPPMMPVLARTTVMGVAWSLAVALTRITVGC